MKYFKIKATRVSMRYPITPEVFLEMTKRKFPFEQRNGKGKLSQYGICPSCLNPIQLIGVVKEIERSPYGRHTGKTIIGLPSWNYKKYEYCPFAVKKDRKEPNDDEWAREIDDGIIELYDLLKNQFDRVIYFLGKELGIRGSAVFWKGVLNQYIVNEFYLYPWLTEANLPYIFAYFGMQHQRVGTQRFRIDSDVYNKLVSYSGVKFINADNGYARLANSDNSFSNFFFRFINHSQRVTEGDMLKESMLFCIDDRKTGETIYEQEIEFKETYFMNLVNKADNADKRQQWLLDIAQELMPELKA